MSSYRAVLDIETAINSHFLDKIDEVAGEESVSLENTFTIYRWERATTIARKNTGPALGLWTQTINTGAASVQKRDWTVNVGIDYVVKGSDLNTVHTQVKLGLQAMMRVIDTLAAGAPSDNFIAAGEDREGTVGVDDIDELLQEAADTSSGRYVGGFRIVLPVKVRETLP